MIWRACSALLAGAVVLVACGGPRVPSGERSGAASATPTPSPGGQPEVLMAAVARVTPQDPPVGAAVAGLTAFGHDLFSAVADRSANTVLSPLSIGYAFAMARAGAEGETAREIDAVLGFPDPGVHAAFNALDRAIVTGDAPPPPAPSATRDAGDGPRPSVVTVANGLFAQRGLAVHEPFLETLAGQYGAGVETVDFTQPDAAKTRIDAWVREYTADRIRELFGSIDPDTLLVLANAVYLKADWETPFAEYPTAPAPFTRADGSAVEAPMMQQLGTMRFATGDGWQAVELPYAGGELAMQILVPTGETPPGDLLDPAVLDAVTAQLAAGTVDLYLPRWDFATDLDLVGSLQELGLTTAFAPGADFSGMTDAGVFIGQAVHRANITVDEWGTEAAAVTGLGFEVSGPPEPDATVRADRPFAFVIRHLPTGAPLFIGQVADPAAS